MEKPIVCENVTVYDYRAHCRFNELMVGRSQWLMYGIASLLGALLIVAYCFMKAAVVLIFAIVILALINLMKFVFQPSSLKKTYGQILALRGEMTFAFRFHDDCFDELCRSNKGEQSVEIAYDALKKILETKEEILFVTKQNTAFYMRKDPDYEYETGELSRVLSALPTYRYRGKKEKKEAVSAQ
ncbi:MAG: hypothetical protein K5753_02700 [Clostridia bacterium]|nr:hypothetical protein [Clostridia bacterium]